MFTKKIIISFISITIILSSIFYYHYLYNKKTELPLSKATVSGIHCNNITLNSKVNCNDTLIGAIETTAQFETIYYNGNNLPINTFTHFINTYNVNPITSNYLQNIKSQLNLNNDWKPLDNKNNINNNKNITTLCYPALGAYHIDKYINNDNQYNKNPNIGIKEVDIAIVDPCIINDKANHKYTLWNKHTYQWQWIQNNHNGHQWINKGDYTSQSIDKLNVKKINDSIFKFKNRLKVFKNNHKSKYHWHFYKDTTEEPKAINNNDNINCNNSICQNILNKTKQEIINPSQDWHDFCEKFVESRLEHSKRYLTANIAWEDIKTKSTNQNNIPPGMRVHFKSTNPAGHVIISLGNNKFLSTDILGYGTIGIVSLEDVTNGIWGLQFLGWGQ